LRGGGGNFGVVTSFLFQLHEMQREVVTGNIAYPLSEARQILKFYAAYSADIPDELGLSAGVGNRLGQEPGVNINFVWSGSAGAADRIVESLRKVGTVVSESVRSMDYVALQRSGDSVGGDVREFTGKMKSGFFESITDAMIDALVDNFEARPDRATRFRFGRTGGAIGRVANADTAFAQRDSNHDLLSFVSWKTSEDGAEHEQYLKSYWSHVDALSLGFYVNDLYDQSQQQINQTYRDNFPRLLKIKKAYDPTNLFRLNANIRAV
jgi:FAD/FMN-containing dehydrogenase